MEKIIFVKTGREFNGMDGVDSSAHGLLILGNKINIL
jgi:hypothetical protein